MGEDHEIGQFAGGQRAFVALLEAGIGSFEREGAQGFVARHALVGKPAAGRLALLVVAGLAFLIGWRFRFTSQGLLLGSLATVAIIALDTFVFWRWRIILPIVLALLAWFLGEFTGRYIGRWLGSGKAGRSG